jgi:spore coat polysaccharide biosynthesis protein SpsF
MQENQPRVIVIAQARMGSSRLPGKVLKQAGGMAIIEHLAHRVLSAQSPVEFWIATTDQPSDDPLAAYPFPSGVSVFRGDEHDVLKRYYNTAVRAKADIIVRVTGDCPLLDPTELDRVIQVYLKGLEDTIPFDYVTNQAGDIRQIPRGLDVEVFSFRVLEHAY